jgi:tetratricopeptide (TPR) repeat protein
MKTLWILALPALAAAGGCMPDHPAAPEELAIERHDAAEKLFAEGHYEEAAVEFEFDVHARPRWKEPYLELAACHEKLHHENDAITVLERLLRIDSTDDAALKCLARLYSERGDTAHALVVVRKLKALHPEDPALDGEIARLEAMGKP